MLLRAHDLYMTFLLNGRQLAKEIEDRLRDEIAIGTEKAGRPPGLAVIRVGDDPASEVYVSNKEKACSRIGVESFGSYFPEKTSEVELIDAIESLNKNDLVDGILLQLPVPQGIDEGLLLDHIHPDKDADGLHTVNLGKLIKGEKGPRSCTPAGVMALLARNNISLKGKRSVVVGRSILVGKPMALMLQAANSTVSVAHSETRDLIDLTRQAEILVVAAGCPLIIGAEHVQKNAVVVDVGIHRIGNGTSLSKSQAQKKLCGDVNFDEVAHIASALTPVPGGVGPMTVTMLLANTTILWQEHCGLSLTLGDLLP